ncbi:hypothetical protein CSC52_0648 [Staphylococcus aureus]|nr:hypothetical protein CSC52_0648 [Staphylococcus aureus]
MWIENFKNKNNETKYRYYEKYKDPYTDKWKRVSVVLNRIQTISKRSNVSFRRKIKKTEQQVVKRIKTLTFHALLDEWLEYHIKHQVQS